jgi:DNA-binding CsgD family transcriptional regulator
MTSLVGRDAELRTIGRLMDQVRGGQARALGVRGEAGIGKSRLLLELAGRARDHAALLLSGRAAELERDLPFALLADALAHGPGGLAGLDPEHASTLAAAIPALGTPSVPFSGERHRVAAAIRALLERLARHRIVVLALDDVHWADPASADVLALLLHRPPRARVLLAMATRTNRAPELEDALAQAVRNGTAELVDLAALSAGAVATLLPELGRAARERLYQQSGGNPFYLEELARTAGDEPTGDPDAAIAGVPRAVRAALTAELRALPERSRRLIQGAAVAGDPFELDLAAVAAARSPDDDAAVLADADTLLTHDLIRPTSAPRRFRFRHPLVRRAVYELSGDGWRLAAHARAARALQARGSAPAQRAHHVERSARPGDHDAVELLSRAADEVLSTAPATAATWYEAASRLLGDAPEQQLRLLTARGQALASAGQALAARDVLRQVLSLLPRDGSPARIQTVEALAQLEGLWTGNPAEARRLLHAERQALGDGARWQHATLTLALARDRATRGDHPGAVSLADEARRTAQLAGDDVLTADAAVQAADSAHCALRTDDPAALAAVNARIADAARLVAALPDERLATRLQMLGWLGVAQFYTTDVSAARAAADRGLALARATGQGFLAPSFLVLRAFTDEIRGDLRAAADAADEVLDNAWLSGNRHLGLWGALVASRVELARGRVQAAIAHGEAAHRFLGVDPTSAAGFTLADAHLAAGDPAAALAGLDTFGWVHPGLWSGDRLLGLDVVVRTLVALGRLDEAASWAERVPAETGGRRTGYYAPIIAHIDATVRLARKDVHTGGAVAREGACAGDEAGAPLWAARCRILAGRALIATGHPDDARRELQHAAEATSDLGAHGIRDAALSALRRLGDRPRVPAGPPGARIGALTPREQEVAALVGDGHTNAQIAHRLHLSERTVEKHVSNVLAKLGVISRSAVIRLVAQGVPDTHPTAPD